MSEALEKLIENLSTKEAARLMTVANEISAAARREFDMEVPLDDVAALVQVRDAVFHGGLDEADMSNALYNLRHHSEVVREHLKQTQGVEEAAKLGADVSSGALDHTTLMSIKSPAARMALARKYGAELPKADRGQRRPDPVHNAREYEDAAETTREAVRRMNEARGVAK